MSSSAEPPNWLMSTNSSIVNEAEEAWSADLTDTPEARFLLYLFYLIIFLVGSSGNLLVCYVVVRNKTMHTVTNILIVNLALSDILLCLFAVPFTPLYLLTFKKWVFGKSLCHLLPFFQGLSVYISAFTLMSIAADRYFVVIYPFKARIKFNFCFFVIFLIWTSASFLTLPYGYFMNFISYSHNNHNISHDIYYCVENWTHEHLRRAFGITTSTLQFVVPFVIILFCNNRICKKLSQRVRSLPGAKSAKKEELEREKTKKINRMLMAMVVVFGLSWLPLNCHNLIQDFYSPSADWSFMRLLFLVSHSIAMSSTCYNPFLYAWLNDNFRKEFKEVLPSFKQSPLRRFSRQFSEKTNNGSGQTQESLILTTTKAVNL